jgi:hypothetical protein
MLTREGEAIEVATCRHCQADIYRYLEPTVDASRRWYHHMTASFKCVATTWAEPERESSAPDE